MPKYAYGLALLAFVVGIGLTLIVVSRMQKTPTPLIVSNADEVSEPTSQTQQASTAPVPEVDFSTCTALTDEATYAKDDGYKLMLPAKEGWFFRTRHDLKSEFEFDDDDLSLLSKLVKVLKERGTELVVTFIPPRGMIATDKLPMNSPIAQAYDKDVAIANYEALLEKLRSGAGLHVVSLTQSKHGSQFFNHADQHWSSKGAQEMAQTVAAYIKEKGLAKDVPSLSFQTTSGEMVNYDGQFGKFTKQICDKIPSPETDIVVNTTLVSADNNEQALFDDAAQPQIVLVGTSNSKREEYNSNFDGYLKEAIGADVMNAAISGGGMDDALLAYLSSEQYRKSPPKILIWEIPSYYELDGKAFDGTLRQALASATGDCDKPLEPLVSGSVKGKKVDLFNGLGDKNINFGQAYVVLKFGKPVSKDFSVSFVSNDGGREKFKFRKRREGNGDYFFYLPKGTDEAPDAPLDSVILNVSKGIEGLSFDAKLCPISL